MESEQRTSESLLPLPDGMFYILLSLRGGEKHGYAIMKEVQNKTDGEIRMGTGSLYRSLGKMLEAGLVDSLEDYPESGNEDERRRYYRLTGVGQRIMLDEFEHRGAKYHREREWLGTQSQRPAGQGE